MNSTDFSQLSMLQLKAFCATHAIDVTGDRRAKSTYILSIETFQSQQTVIEIEIETLPAIPDPFENQFETDLAIDLPLTESADLYIESDGSAVSPPSTTQHRGASIVIVVIATMLWSLFLLIAEGLRLLTHLIAAVVRLSVTIWGFSNREDVPMSFFLISSAQS